MNQFWHFHVGWCLSDVARQISNLLCYATHPEAEPLDNAWLDTIKRDISCATNSALDAHGCAHLGEPLRTQLNKARSLSFQFATLLHDRPILSTVPVEEWTVPRYRHLFNDLSEMERKISRLGDDEEAAYQRLTTLIHQEPTPASSDNVTLTPNGEPAIAVSTALPPCVKAVYISYAWGDDRSKAGHQRGEVVERLCDKLIDWGYDIVRDKNELRNGDLISKFMQQIGRGKRVLVILSKKYLLSSNCMTELFYVYQRSIGDKQEFLRRVIPVVVDDARDITDWRERVKYAEHWQREFKEMESHLSVLGEDDLKRYRLIKQWHAVIGEILGFISDELHPHGFENIVKNDFAAVRELLARIDGEPITP